MAKVSSAPEDAFHFKGSFEEGWGIVTAARATVFQYPPTKEAKNNRAAGHQDPPGLVVELTIQRMMDGDGTKNPQPPEEVLLSIQKADKLTGELSACHPGNFPDGDLNVDPEDAGGELGAEGNTLFAMQDGYQLNDKCKWMRFTSSLVEKGFKPAILKRTYFPDLVGLYAYFKNEQAKTGDFDSNLFIVNKIVKFPYEGGAQTGKPAAAAKGKAAAGKPAPAAKAAPAAAQVKAESNGAGAGSDLSAEDIATAILTDTLAPAQKGALLTDLKKLRVLALMSINKHKPAVPPELKKAVQDVLTEDWLDSMGAVTELYEVQTDGGVQFV